MAELAGGFFNKFLLPVRFERVIRSTYLWSGVCGKMPPTRRSGAQPPQRRSSPNDLAGQFQQLMRELVQARTESNSKSFPKPQ